TELLNVAFAGLGGRLHDTIGIRRAIVRVAVHDRGTEVRDAIHGDAPPGTTERSEQPCTFAPIERVDALHDARVVGDGQARTVADFAARSVALQVVVGAPDRSAVLSAVGVDRHEVPTLAVDARLLRSAGDARVRALAIPARAAMVGVRVGIDAGVPAGDERDGARQGAGPADADLTRGADLASAPRAVSAALGRAAVAPIGVRVHAGAVAHDERSRAGDHALARDADLAGIACGPGRPTVLAAAFGRPAVLAVALGIDAGAAAF